LRSFVNFYHDRLGGPGWTARLIADRADVSPSDHISFAVLSSMICLRHLDAGELDACDREARHAIDALLRAGMASGTAYLHTYMARAQAIRGNLDAAEACIARAVAIVRDPVAEIAQLEQLAAVHAAAIALERGDLVTGQRLIREGWPFLSSFDGWYDAIAEAIGTSVRLALAAGDMEEVQRALDQGEIVARLRSLPRLQLVITAWRLVHAVAIGEPAGVAAGKEAFDHCLRRQDQDLTGNTYYLSEALGYANACHALFHQDSAAAKKMMVAQAARAEGIGALPQMRRCLLLAGQAAHLAGESRSAIDLVRRALRGIADVDVLRASILVVPEILRDILARAMDMGALFDPVAQAVASAFVGGLPSATPSEPSLSVREQQILQLVGAGMTTKEIARTLSISDSTVKFHRKRIYTKLGVNRRSLALAIYHGQVPAAEAINGAGSRHS
jgi:DNA-binding CsgD family transcriptional regulator